MKLKSVTLLGLVTGAAGLAVSAYGLSNGLTAKVTKAADSYSLTINNETANTIALEDCEIFTGKVDKKFTYQLGPDKYIEGWFLHNYVEGQTVGSYLGSQNTSSGAYFDYNFIFSIRGVTSVSFNPYYVANSHGSGVSAIGVLSNDAFKNCGYDFAEFVKQQGYTYEQVRATYSPNIYGYSNQTNQNVLYDAGGRYVSTNGTFKADLICCSFTGDTGGGNEIKISFDEVNINYTC